LSRLTARRDAAAQTVERIVGLLARADERRLREPHDARRWNSVIDHLETSLHDARARLGLVQAECDRVQHQLTGSAAPPPPPPPPAPAAPQPAPTPELSAEPREAARQLLALDLDQLASLTMEQVSQLHSHLREGAVPGAIEEMERVAGRIELAIQSPAPPPGGTERRGQEVLRHAVGRLQLGEVGALSRREATLVLSCHELLERKLSPTPADERLKSLLAPHLPALRARVAELPG
jgi:hypothetical protein